RGRGGSGGKPPPPSHLSPPPTGRPEKSRFRAGASFPRHWESPLRPLGGIHHALRQVEAAPGRDVYRGLGRLIANATAAMNVTSPTAPMDYFFEHHSATLVFFVHEGAGTLETTFGPIAYGKGDFLIVPKGITH